MSRDEQLQMIERTIESLEQRCAEVQAAPPSARRTAQANEISLRLAREQRELHRLFQDELEDYPT